MYIMYFEILIRNYAMSKHMQYEFKCPECGCEILLCKVSCIETHEVEWMLSVQTEDGNHELDYYPGETHYTEYTDVLQFICRNCGKTWESIEEVPKIEL